MLYTSAFVVLLTSAVSDPPNPATDAAHTPSRTPRGQRAAAAGFMLGSAGLWGGTIALRATLWDRYRDYEASCGHDPSLFCFVADVGFGLDRLKFSSASYATALPATALLGGAGYFLGAARGDKPAPRLAKTGGIALVAVGLAAWAVPRVMLSSGMADSVDLRDKLLVLDATFYAGLGVVGLGAASIGFHEGRRSGRGRRRRARLEGVSLSGHGVQIRGAF